MTANEPSPLRTGRSRARRGGFGIPRVLPWSSPLTRMWPGTKLVCLCAISTLTLLRPTWWTLGLTLALYAAATWAARVPRGAVPRLPLWAWSGVIGGALASWYGGGVLDYVLFVLLGLAVGWGSLLLVWTTRPESLAGTAATLLRPLAWLKVPIDEWIAAIALTTRGQPVIAEELRHVLDASRIRGGALRHVRGRSTYGERQRALWGEAGDVLTATVSASQRRAADTGRAMTLRGGMQRIERVPLRLGWVDLLAVLGTVAVVAAAWVL